MWDFRFLFFDGWLVDFRLFVYIIVSFYFNILFFFLRHCVIICDLLCLCTLLIFRKFYRITLPHTIICTCFWRYPILIPNANIKNRILKLG
ncbi:hypothetical protein HanPSC8_Chr09g0398681 [Helianthus annuus]|nr:hypothetical protein HanPSC8_Chr09g0398681 [Helianthus annuus]